ncbi:MAG TPA: universal stress protein [Acidimicrobiales bacterium]|nr:universal stress protein [Acidimicrobiales bacterium]
MDASTEKTGTIVVGVDGDDSVDALRWAATQAELSGSSLEVITSWTWPTAWGREPTWPPGWDPDEQTRKQLAEVVEGILGPHPGLEVRQVVVEGHAAPVLIAAAEHADLLVIGSHGHGAIAGMFLGSVSMHCVAQAPCPVVVVHRRVPKVG